MRNIIEVRNLTKSYGSRKAVDNLSFEVKGVTVICSFVGIKCFKWE